jgi:tetratricopeptide (TPR) repeat protein
MTPIHRRWFSTVCVATLALTYAMPVLAQESPVAGAQPPGIDLPKTFDGEADFEEATRLRLNVDSVDTLKEIIALAESALKKGLDEADQEAARKLIAASYVQKTEESIALLSNGKRLSQSRLNKLLNEFIEDLGSAIENDPLMIDAYLMKAELLARRNQREEAKEVADAGVKALTDFMEKNKVESDIKAKVSKMLMMRAGLQDEEEKVVEDLQKSIKINPNNTTSIILLSKSLLERKRADEAVTFLQSVMESSPDNELLICTTAELMAANPARTDEAIALLDTKFKTLSKSVPLLKTRAQLHSNKARRLEDEARSQELALAQADLDRALELAKEDVGSLLSRARILLLEKKTDEAKRDVDAALELDPTLVEAIQMRSAVASEQKRFADAINDLQLIIKNEPKDGPKNVGLLLNLGLLYVQDNRHAQGIKVFDQVVKLIPDAWEPYRFRGDARLGTFDYANAIADFEKALELLPDGEEDRSGILNNLSWILSTSEPDGIRDGKRALELGLEACELTNYDKHHILSTLGAAYAELGQFDKAIEWSEKAVELARKRNDEQLEQYESELKSYKEGKPWREKMESKENRLPIVPGDTGVET